MSVVSRGDCDNKINISSSHITRHVVSRHNRHNIVQQNANTTAWCDLCDVIGRCGEGGGAWGIPWWWMLSGSRDVIDTSGDLTPTSSRLTPYLAVSELLCWGCLCLFLFYRFVFVWWEEPAEEITMGRCQVKLAMISQLTDHYNMSLWHGSPWLVNYYILT